jgi:hypothetical protein
MLPTGLPTPAKGRQRPARQRRHDDRSRRSEAYARPRNRSATMAPIGTKELRAKARRNKAIVELKRYRRTHRRCRARPQRRCNNNRDRSEAVAQCDSGRDQTHPATCGPAISGCIGMARCPTRLMDRAVRNPASGNDLRLSAAAAGRFSKHFPRGCFKKSPTLRLQSRGACTPQHETCMEKVLSQRRER